MSSLRNPEFVKYTPIVTTLLLEGANVSQIMRMVRERTAEGQSLTAWIMVSVALMMWLNFYRVCTPNQKWAIWATTFGILLNLVVIITVIHYRFYM